MLKGPSQLGLGPEEMYSATIEEGAWGWVALSPLYTIPTAENGEHLRDDKISCQRLRCWRWMTFARHNQILQAKLSLLLVRMKPGIARPKHRCAAGVSVAVPWPSLDEAQARGRPYGGRRCHCVRIIKGILHGGELCCRFGLQNIAKHIDGALRDQAEEARRLGARVLHHGRQHAGRRWAGQQDARRVELGDTAVVQDKDPVRILPTEEPCQAVHRHHAIRALYETPTGPGRRGTRFPSAPLAHHDGRQAVGDGEHRPVGELGANRLLDQGVRLHVHAARRLRSAAGVYVPL